MQLMARIFFVISTGVLTALMLAFVSTNTTFEHQVIDIDDDDLQFTFDPDTTRKFAGFQVFTPGCQILEMNPFDPSVKSLYSKTGPLKCSGPAPLVTHSSTKVSIRSDVWSSYYRSRYGDFGSCWYKEIRRDGKNKSDNKISVDKSQKPLVDEMHLPGEFYEISCKSNRGTVVYNDFIPLIQVKPEVEERCNETNFNGTEEKPDRLNVVFVGIDSVSRLNFLRHLPQTYKYLMEVMGALDLRGYNKVADNTYPNVVPLLAGLHLEQVWSDSTGRKKPLDYIPLIWKNYSKNGYRTLFAEDAPNIATFNYLKEGFYYQPTDYYLRPFNLATENSQMRKRSRGHCFNSRPEIAVILDWLKDFLTNFHDKPHFAYLFNSRLTHDVLNYAGHADNVHYDFFKETNEKGYYNNSVLFFFSDHGIRFGKIRETYIGKLEERLPGIFIVFPKWFRLKYKEIWKNLVTNQRMLTTPFDIFETLKDILYFNGTIRKFDVSDRGISLFSEIPPIRTCEHASILPHWCTCSTRTKLSVNDSHVKNAVSTLLQYINDALAEVKDKCAELLLDKIIDIRGSTVNEHVMTFKLEKNKKKAPTVHDFLITVQARPGFGHFEGTVRYFEDSKEYRVMGDVSRINLYGTQSWCVADATMRKFCYCKK